MQVVGYDMRRAAIVIVIVIVVTGTSTLSLMAQVILGARAGRVFEVEMAVMAAAWSAKSNMDAMRMKCSLRAHSPGAQTASTLGASRDRFRALNLVQG